MWSLLIPFLATHLYELVKIRSLSKLFLQNLWIVSSFALLCFLIPTFLALPLWICLSSYLLLRWYCLFHFQIDLTFQTFHFLKSFRCFIDSIKALPKYFFLTILISLPSLTAFQTPPSLSFWLPLFLFSGFLSLLYTTKKTNQRQNSLPIFPFPNELSLPFSPKFPALRKTLSFLGEKNIHIPPTRPHVIFIFLESFRAKNIGCLNAQIPASPHFDEWAKKGLLFSNFRANGLQTFRAFISAYFGIPSHMQTVSLKPFCEVSLYGLPQILKKHGYHPALIQSGDLSFDYLYPFFKQHGFETILGGENIPTNKKRPHSWGINDECTVRFAADFLAKQTSPTFLSLFTITNHHPWKAPSDWNFSPPQNIPPIYQNFLQTFAFTDHCLGIFLDLLKAKGILENSIVFIAGDHGQEMYERRPFSEMNHSLFDESIHLPLLLLGEKIPSKVIDDPASFIDFPPTVMDLLNIQDVHHGLGRSLLRKHNSPSYFSLQREHTEIGSVMGRKKIIIAPNQVLKFDLDCDKEEKTNIATPQDPQVSACIDYFRKIETIYHANAWAPEPKLPFEMKGTEAMDDEEWLSFLHSHPPVSVIDLSQSHRLTDNAILQTKPEYGAVWHRLNIANVNVTDQSLEWIYSHCPNIMSLNLSYCHLLSDAGVKELLSKCLQLRHLWLDGIYDLSDFVPHNTLFPLITCSLKDLRHIPGQTLVRLYANSPHLINWSASLENTTTKDLLEMSVHKKQSTHMNLSHGHRVKDEGLTALIESQNELQEIHLEDFPLLETPLFSSLLKLRYLEFSNCPNLTDGALQLLQHLPLMRLQLDKCPKITQKGLSFLAHNPNLHIFLSECPGIKHVSGPL